MTTEDYKHIRHDNILITDNASAFLPARRVDSIATLERAAAKSDVLVLHKVLKHLVPMYQRQPAEASPTVAERTIAAVPTLLTLVVR